MQNKSGLKPLGVAVLIKTYEPERKGGVIEIPDVVQGRLAMVDNRAVVVEAGPAAWHDEPCPRAAPGDKVLVTRYAGFMAKGPLDGEQYRLVNDRDIFCQITGEGEVRVQGEQEKDVRSSDDIAEEHAASFIRRDRIGNLDSKA